MLLQQSVSLSFIDNGKKKLEHHISLLRYKSDSM